MKKKDHDFKAKKFEKLLIERPQKMSYEEYKQKRREQNRRLKARLNGFMVWPSKAYGIINNNGQHVPGGESWGTLVGKVPAVQIK